MSIQRDLGQASSQQVAVLETEIRRLQAEVEQAERERDEARRWAEQHIKLTCAFCGQQYPAEGASARLLEEHVRACEAHPMRSVEAELDAAHALLADTQASLREHMHDIHAYRGALGYPVPGDHDGRLSDGTTPQCGLCDAARAEVARLTAEREEWKTRANQYQVTCEEWNEVAAERDTLPTLPSGWREVPDDDESAYANYGNARWANTWCVVWVFKDGYVGVSGQVPVSELQVILRHAQQAHERMQEVSRG